MTERTRLCVVDTQQPAPLLLNTSTTLLVIVAAKCLRVQILVG